MTTADYADLYIATIKAENAWMAEIRRHTGKVCSIAHGKPGSSLRAAYDAYNAAYDTWQSAHTMEFCNDHQSNQT